MTPLRRERERRNWTQAEVAEAVGIERSHYCRIENGEAAASPQVAEKLAAHFSGAITEMEILYPERYASETPAKSTAAILQAKANMKGLNELIDYVNIIKIQQRTHARVLNEKLDKILAHLELPPSR